jgi:regulation of enolase protein 1 (concanavalin A-like superfamily)
MASRWLIRSASLLTSTSGRYEGTLSSLIRQAIALLASALCGVVTSGCAAEAQTAWPAGWTNRDIGAPVIAGSASYNNGVIMVRGAGANIWGTADQFQFAYRAASGDMDMRIRVDNFTAVDPWAKAGIMIRESLNATAKNAFMLLSAGRSLALQSRAQTGGTTARVLGASSALPVWIRLVRLGNAFRAYTSANGASWTFVGSATITMSTNTYVGLAVTSRNPSQTGTAIFSGLVFDAPATLPAPWTARDIGSPILAGSASAAGGSFIVQGAGQDIWSTSDQFRFVFHPVTGDTQITAWIGNLQAPNVATKAGVMIRGDLTASAANAFMLMAGSRSWGFQRRLSARGMTYITWGGAAAASGWVRLVRQGNLVTAYRSANGSQWMLVDSDAISMPPTVYIGLALTSHAATALATATFTSVAVGGSSPPAPPARLVFLPGADYATNATSCVVELRRAADPRTAPPVATRNLGKPAVVSGEISVDISTLVDPLPAGSYYAIVVTIGSGGSTPSSPSAAFTR